MAKPDKDIKKLDGELFEKYLHNNPMINNSSLTEAEKMQVIILNDVYQKRLNTKNDISEVYDTIKGTQIGGLLKILPMQAQQQERN